MSENKNKFKYSIILVISAIIIILNVAFLNLIKNKPTPDIPETKTLKYYDTYFTNLMIYNNKGENLKLPDFRNTILIGLNKDFEKKFDKVYQFISTFDLTNYNVRILIVLDEDVIKQLHSNSKVFFYSDKEFTKYYNLDENSNFIFLIDKFNKIRYYASNLISKNDLKLLIERNKN